jgi:IMP cyclohydrolase
MKLADENDVRNANDNVIEAADDAVKTAVDGHPATQALATSTVIVQVYADNNITTRIAGLVNKNQLFGALVEAILSIHEVDRNAALGEVLKVQDAFYEKLGTDERTDN